MLKQLDTFHQSKPGLLAFGLVELAIAYGLASLSIDRGNFLWYLLTLVFFVGSLRNILKLVGLLLRKKVSHGKD